MSERSKETARLSWLLLHTRETVAVVHGAPGSGRSTVVAGALSALRRKAAFVAHCCCGDRPLRVATALQAASAALGSTQACRSPAQLAQCAVAAARRHAVASLHIVVVVDGDDDEEVAPLAGPGNFFSAIAELPGAVEASAAAAATEIDVRAALIAVVREPPPALRLACRGAVAFVPLRPLAPDAFAAAATRLFERAVCAAPKGFDCGAFVRFVRDLHASQLPCTSAPASLAAIALRRYVAASDRLADAFAKGGQLAVHQLLAADADSRRRRVQQQQRVRVPECLRAEAQKRLLVAAYLASRTRPAFDKDFATLDRARALRAKVHEDARPFALRRLLHVHDCLFVPSGSSSGDDEDGLRAALVPDSAWHALGELVAARFLRWAAGAPPVRVVLGGALLECLAPRPLVIETAMLLDPPLQLEEVVENV